MIERRRRSLSELNIKDYSLYRVICAGLEDLQQEIVRHGAVTVDMTALAIAMQDRRLLVKWLRELRFPPASLYNDCGITEAVEDLLIRGSIEDPG